MPLSEKATSLHTGTLGDKTVVERLRRVEECTASFLAFDRLLKLRTEHRCPDTVTSFYGEIELASMAEVLQGMHVDADSTVLDFGCGAGRWLIAAGMLGARNAIGVEFVQERADAARYATEGLGCLVFTGDGLDPSNGVWEHAPTHVVAYDLAFAENVRRDFWRRVRNVPSVRSVAVWHKAAVGSGTSISSPSCDFRLTKTLNTTSTTNECFDCYVYTR